MNTPSPAVTTDTTQAVDTSSTTFEQRFDALSNEVYAESPETADATGEAAAPLQGAPPDASAASADPAAAQRAVERRQRLDALRTQTRDQVDRKAALAAQDKLARDYATAQKRADDAEALAAKRLDVDTIDEAAWLKLAEQRNIDPGRVASWVRDSIQNPERLAEAAALKATQAAYDPKLAAIQAENAALKARLDAFEQSQHQERMNAQERQQTQQFLGMVSQSSDRAPLASKLLAANQEEFLLVASLAAESVPGMGAHALLDAVEDFLDGNGRQAAQTYAALYGLSSPASATQPTSRGAAKPTTVSNSFAQERASIVEEDSLGGLSFDDRLARLKSMR